MQYIISILFFFFFRNERCFLYGQPIVLEAVSYALRLGFECTDKLLSGHRSEV